MQRTDMEHLYHYCERAGDAGLWAEPLNFVTNLAFIVFGVLAWRFLRAQPHHSFRQTGDLWALAIAMLLIGLGSALWHSWAKVGWTVMVDTIPIYLFINIYIFSLFRRLAEWSWLKVGILWLVFTGFSTLIQQSLPMQTLNGSLMYLPTFGLMFLSGLYLMLSGKYGGRSMMLLSGLFLVSLTFRTLDLEVCSMIPIGTHYIWHILNALLLYRLLRLLNDKPAMA